VSISESVVKKKLVTLRIDNLPSGEHSVLMSMRYGEINYYVKRCIRI
jgi:hypothetical protein